jgi:hypothetical protein
VPRVTVLPNGVTASCPRYGPLLVPPSKRGKIDGWTLKVTRRLRRWFYSVDGQALDGYGYAATFTVRDLPPRASDWVQTRDRFFRRLRRSRLIRGQHLTEWQRRRVPHMHGCFYLPEPGLEAELIDHWLGAAADWRPEAEAQHVKPVWGLPGWLQYQAKHSARGVRHYQRANVPEAWQTGTGKLWGTLGEWPLREDRLNLDAQTFWRFRRSLRGWLLSGARREAVRTGKYHRVAFLRRMLADPERVRSAVRAVGEFCPEAVSWQLLHASMLDAERGDVVP